MGALMENTNIAVTTLLICSCVGLIFICALALQKRPESGAAAVDLALCGICVVIYDFGYAMEIHSISLSETMFWVRFQHWGIQPLPPLWLMFALFVSGKKKLVTLKTGLLLFILPLAALAASQTLGGLNIMHPNARLAAGEMLSRFAYDRGWVIYLVTAVQCLYLGASIVLFAIGFFRGKPVPRRQAAIYLFGSLLPWASSLAYNYGLTPYNTDTTPLVLSLSVALFIYGLLKAGVLEKTGLA